MIELINHTKLSNVAIAIRTCYDSFGPNKGEYNTPTDNLTKEDKELVYKVVNKYKHASTSEHCRLLFETDKDIATVNSFRSNPFSRVYDTDTGWRILTNLRVLLENPKLTQLVRLPKEFDFLFENTHE